MAFSKMLAVILSWILSREGIKQGVYLPLMASLWKHPESKYWTACYTDKDGRQRKQSTKIAATEKNRRAAMLVADELEKAHKRRMTTSQIVRMCGGLVKELTDQEVSSVTTGDFLDGYVKRRSREVSKATLAAYKGAATRFKTWLGESAAMELFRIEKRHGVEFRDHIANSLNPNTVNHTIKVLRVFFTDAKRDGLIFDNPFQDVPLLRKERNENARRGFKVEEIHAVVREVTGTEWVSLIRFGLYTGQRLGDLAGLRWSAVDLAHDEIRFTTAKTGRVVIVPLCTPLKKHLLSLPAGDVPDAPVHPRAAEMGVSHLSREFGEVLARCGFRVKANHDKAKNGRASRRELNALSFHSLRHSAVSMMKNAGISPAVVQDLVGHDSAEMSAHYTHIESEAKRRALDTLPVI